MWLIVMLAALLMLLALYAWLIRPNLPRRELTGLQGVHYAHRGLWNQERPENSLAAFAAAAEKGYGVELDVHLTADGALVVHHDDSLKRLTGVDIRIGQSSLEQIRACRLANGEPIPTYDEVLETIAGRIPMVVEVKVENGNHAALSKAVYERMQRYDGPWCLESFDPKAVGWFRRNAPEIIRGQLAFDAAGKGKDVKTWMRNIGIASMLQNIWGRPDFIAFDAKSVKWRTLSIHLLRLMKPWFVAWTVRSQEDLEINRKHYDLQIFEKFEAR